MFKIWLRGETKSKEKRTPLTPDKAKILVAKGCLVTVEDDPNRIFNIKEYKKAGCQIVPFGSWQSAPLDHFILGLKEISDPEAIFKHKHIYFAHIFKGQNGSQEILSRYKRDGGTLFDLEYLTDEFGKRISAFGKWAGFAGAAFALDRFYQRQGKDHPPYPGLKSYPSVSALTEQIERNQTNAKIKDPTVIVIGALGRCGGGAIELFEKFGVQITKWDYEETKLGGPFPQILEHDIFLNAVLITKPVKPFLNSDILKQGSNELSLIADVSCDPTSELNPIPIYNQSTTWEKPFHSYSDQLEILSVDNLPSTLPLESSIDFCDQLFPWLLELSENELNLPIPFQNALMTFEGHLKENC